MCLKIISPSSAIELKLLREPWSGLMSWRALQPSHTTRIIFAISNRLP